MTADVELESNDPETGETVSVSFSPEGVKAQQPGQAVMSIVVREAGATDGVEAVWMMFCHQVHFFASRETGERFFEGKAWEGKTRSRASARGLAVSRPIRSGRTGYCTPTARRG